MRPAGACLLFLAVGCAATSATELTGRVTSQGLPIPGAGVTLIAGDMTYRTVTHEDGFFTFSNVPEGTALLQVEMFGFEPVRRQVRLPSPELHLELQLAVTPLTQARAVTRPSGDAIGQRQPSPSETQSSLPPETLVNLDALERDANESFLLSGSLSQGVTLTERPVLGFGLEGRGLEPLEGALAEIFRGERRDEGPPAGGFGPVLMGRGMGPGGPPPVGFPGAGPAGGRFGGPPGVGLRGQPGSRPASGPPQAARRPEWMRGRGVVAFGNRQRVDQALVRGRLSLSLNSSALDAKPYSISGQPIPKPDYARVRFDISAGGPLRIPRLLQGRGGMFFFDYSGMRSRDGFDRIATVPSPAERTGDFSSSWDRGPVRVYDLWSGAPFPGNRIPSSRMDPAALGLLELIPLPNLPGRVQNYQLITSIPNNLDRFNLRLGQSLGRIHRLSGSVSLERRYRESAQLFGFRDEARGQGLAVGLNWLCNLSPAWIHTLGLRFNRMTNDSIPYFAYRRDVAGELGILGTPRDPVAWGPPNLNFTNFGDLTDGNPSLFRNNSWSLSQGWTWVRGPHTLRFGFDYQRTQRNQLTYLNARGTHTFTGLLTSGFDAAGHPLPRTGFDFADFLLGLPQSSTIRWGNPDIYFRAGGWNGYFVEDWRLKPGLTLNLGIRYEYASPWFEKYDRMANLDVAPGFRDVAVVTPRTTGPYSGRFPRGLVNPDRNNFAPRVALAWRPSQRGSLVVRLGYGIYYNGGVYSSIATRLAQQPPFALTNTFVTSLEAPLTIRTGFLGEPSAELTNTYAVQRDYRIGYAQVWNVSLQRNLPWSLFLELAYLGTKGTALDVQRSPNQAPPGSPLDAERRRPIPYAVAFIYDSSDGHSIYHSGRVRLLRRLRRGLSFSTSYVWGKSIDNVSTYGGGLGVIALDPFDLRRERGLSSFDRRHSLDASLFILSPVGEGPGLWNVNGFLRRLLEQWRLSGTFRWDSGRPFTAMVMGNRADTAGTGVTGNGRADATGLPVRSETGFFNLDAFTIPPPGRYGNAGRNTIPGPASLITNLSLGRGFQLGSERRELEVRLEAENAFNTVNITRIGTTVNASNYGLATAAGPMRRVSLELRLRF